VTIGLPEASGTELRPPLLHHHQRLTEAELGRLLSNHQIDRTWPT